MGKRTSLRSLTIAPRCGHLDLIPGDFGGPIYLQTHDDACRSCHNMREPDEDYTGIKQRLKWEQNLA